ncbi:MAG TPA: ABC transporter permease [Thermoleophilaceae bacterium]|jgi:putative spermidine/putrescine transport system permease protein
MSGSSAPESAATAGVPLGLGSRIGGFLRRRRGLVTAAWAAPGTLWLLFFLVAPVIFIVLVGFWERTITGFDESWTLDNFRSVFGSDVYWDTLRQSFQNALIVVAASLVLGFPVAYFLAIEVESLRNQIAFFIIALAPFWTSFLIRAVAWVPMMGREGALNRGLMDLGVIDKPLDFLLFSNFAVIVGMLQLYILFMVAPLFFMLAQIDKASLEAARDLGANWFKTFREVILPQVAPGIVIGSIFVFVLSMGDFGTTRVLGGATVSSVGLIVQNEVTSVQFPQAAASATILVLFMMVGVFVLLRFSNLREEL